MLRCHVLKIYIYATVGEICLFLSAFTCFPNHGKSRRLIELFADFLFISGLSVKREHTGTLKEGEENKKRYKNRQ